MLFGSRSTATAAPGRMVQTLARTHQVRMEVRAASTAANAGLNFDGYAFGRLVFTVPLGWRVQVAFRNVAPLPHSLVIEPWSEASDLRHPLPAFPGASSPDPYAGTRAGGSASFTFVASRPGRYRIACAVPGHRDLGMWDTLVVSRSAHAASVRVLGPGAGR